MTTTTAAAIAEQEPVTADTFVTSDILVTPNMQMFGVPVQLPMDLYIPPDALEVILDAFHGVSDQVPSVCEYKYFVIFLSIMFKLQIFILK